MDSVYEKSIIAGQEGRVAVAVIALGDSPDLLQASPEKLRKVVAHKE